MKPSELRRRARWSYELGRVRFAAPYGLAAAFVVACAWLISPPSAATLGLAMALIVASVGLAVASRSLARQVWPGLMAGLVPMVAALATVRAHGCAADCDVLCAPICALAGVAVGAWLGRSRARWGALVVASLTAATGCYAVGAGTFVGALFGLALGSAPMLVWRRSTGS